MYLTVIFILGSTAVQIVVLQQTQFHFFCLQVHHQEIVQRIEDWS